MSYKKNYCLMNTYPSVLNSKSLRGIKGLSGNIVSTEFINFYDHLSF